MRVIKSERIGDRRVRMVVLPDGASAVTIETIGPEGAWVDISLRADARLRAGESERRYRLRCDELRIKIVTLIET
jgi:hypothetical protein